MSLPLHSMRSPISSVALLIETIQTVFCRSLNQSLFPFPSSFPSTASSSHGVNLITIRVGPTAADENVNEWNWVGAVPIEESRSAAGAAVEALELEIIYIILWVKLRERPEGLLGLCCMNIFGFV